MNIVVAQLPPSAQMALQAASLLSSEPVPWSWLEQTLSEYATASDASQSDWPTIKQTLLDANLVTSSIDDMVSMAPDTAEQLRPAVDSPVADAVRSMLLSRAIAGNDLDALTNSERALVIRLLPTFLDGATPQHERLAINLALNTVDSLLHASRMGLANEVLMLAADIDRLVPRESSDLNAQRARMRVFRLVGSLTKHRDPYQAQRAYRQALPMARHFVDVLPDETQAIYELSGILTSLAEVTEDIDREQALSYYLEALAIDRGLMKTHPDNDSVRLGLAAMLNNIGVFFADTDPHQALGYFQEMLALYRQLVLAHPTDVELLEKLAYALSNLGTLTASMDGQQSMDYYAEALDHFRSLTESVPDDPELRFNYAVLLMNTAGLSDGPERLSRAEEATSLAVQLHQAFPDAPQVSPRCTDAEPPSPNRT